VAYASNYGIQFAISTAFGTGKWIAKFPSFNMQILAAVHKGVVTRKWLSAQKKHGCIAS